MYAGGSGVVDVLRESHRHILLLSHTHTQHSSAYTLKYKRHTNDAIARPHKRRNDDGEARPRALPLIIKISLRLFVIGKVY